MKRIPGLDGLRAVSILMVLAGHIAGTRHAYSLKTFLLFGDLAHFGVRVFFVISGYLITSLLIGEFEKTGTVSIKAFYLRRTLRIFPAFYFFLFIIALCSQLGLISLGNGDLLHGLTYTINYFPQRSWIVGHIWSLSVEEQFYLLWPATIVVFGLRRASLGAIGVVLLAPVLRFIVLQHWGSAPVGEWFPTTADSIATGCLLAVCMNHLELPFDWRKVTYFWPGFAVLAFLLNLKSSGRLSAGIFETLINFCIAICIAHFATTTAGRTARLLNSQPAVFIGGLSYSLYLWQQPFLNRTSDAICCVFPLNLILAFCAAVICHYAVEKPFLALRSSGWVRAFASGELSKE